MDDQIRGYTIELRGECYDCPELGLYGFRSRKALARAIDKKLGHAVTRSARRAWRGFANA